MVAGRVPGEGTPRRVRLSLLVRREQKKVARRRRRRHRERGLELPERRRHHQHLPDARTHRQGNQVLAQRGEALVVPTQRADRDEQVDRVGHRARLRGLDGARQERRGGNAFSAEALHREHELLQRRARHLGHGVLRHARVRGSRVQPYACTGAHAPRASATLARGRLADPGWQQARHVVQRVVGLLLALAAVHDVHDVVDGDGGLGDVGGQDHLARAAPRLVEDLALVRGGHLPVQRQDQKPRRVAEHVVRRAQIAYLHDIVPAGEENENRARRELLRVPRRMSRRLPFAVFFSRAAERMASRRRRLASLGLVRERDHEAQGVAHELDVQRVVRGAVRRPPPQVRDDVRRVRGPLGGIPVSVPVELLGFPRLGRVARFFREPPSAPASARAPAKAAGPRSALRKRFFARSVPPVSYGDGRARRENVTVRDGRKHVPGAGQQVLQERLAHGVREPGNVELAFARNAEVVGEDAGVHRRRHQHHSQVRPFGQEVSQHDEQKVLVHAPLVDLVHEHVRHAPQRRVGRQPPEKHARRAKLQPGAFPRDARLQPDAVPYGLAHRLAALVRHARSHRDGAYPPRLRAHDARRRGAALGERALQNKLGTLRGFAAAGLAGDHRDLVRGDRL